MENNEPIRSEDKLETVSTGSQISPHGFIEDGSADGYPIDYSFMAKDLAEAAAKKESTPAISQENADHLTELRNFRDQTNIKVGENLPTTEPDRKDGMAEEAAKKKDVKHDAKEVDEATYNEALRKNIALKEQNKILLEQNNQLKNRIDVLENRLDQLIVILIQTGRIPASMTSMLNNPQNVVGENQPTVVNRGTITTRTPIETTPLKPEQGSSAQQLDIYIQSLINQRSSTTQGETPPPITQQVIDQSNEISERIKANTPPALPTTPPELTPENIAQSNAISEWLKNQPPVLTPEIIAQGQKAEEEWKRKNTPPELPTTPPTLTQENLDWIKANTPPPVPGTVPPAITQSVIDQSNDISEWLKANTPPPVTRSVIRQGKRAGEQWEKANTPPPLPTTPPELTPDNIAWMNANTPPPIPETPPALPTTPPELTSENLEWIKANTPPPVPGTVPPAITQSVIDQSNAIRSAMTTPPPLPTTPPALTQDNLDWMKANTPPPIPVMTPPPLTQENQEWIKANTPPPIPEMTPPALPTTPPELTPSNIAWMDANKPQGTVTPPPLPTVTPPLVQGVTPPPLTAENIAQSNAIRSAMTPPPIPVTPPALPTTPPELTPDNIAWINANNPQSTVTPPPLPTIPPTLTQEDVNWMNANRQQTAVTPPPLPSTPPPIPGATPPELPITPPVFSQENLAWIEATTPPPIPEPTPPVITQEVIDQSNTIRNAMTPPPINQAVISQSNAIRSAMTPPTLPTPPELTPDNIAWMENNKPQSPTEVIPNDSGFAGWTSNVQGGMEKTPQIVNEEIPARTTPPELPDWLLNPTAQAQQNTDSDVLTPNTGFSNWLSNNPSALEENTPKPSMTSQLDSAINNLIQSSPQIEVQPTITTNNRREKYVGPAKQMMRTLGK